MKKSILLVAALISSSLAYSSATFYRDSSLRGWSKYIDSDSLVPSAQLEQLRIYNLVDYGLNPVGNDRASSASVKSGHCASLHKHSGLQGTSITIGPGTTGGFGSFNDEMSSLYTYRKLTPSNTECDTATDIPQLWSDQVGTSSRHPLLLNGPKGQYYPASGGEYDNNRETVRHPYWHFAVIEDMSATPPSFTNWGVLFGRANVSCHISDHDRYVLSYDARSNSNGNWEYRNGTDSCSASVPALSAKYLTLPACYSVRLYGFDQSGNKISKDFSNKNSRAELKTFHLFSEGFNNNFFGYKITREEEYCYQPSSAPTPDRTYVQTFGYGMSKSAAIDDAMEDWNSKYSHATFTGTSCMQPPIGPAWQCNAKGYIEN